MNAHRSYDRRGSLDRLIANRHDRLRSPLSISALRAAPLGHRIQSWTSFWHPIRCFFSEPAHHSPRRSASTFRSRGPSDHWHGLPGPHDAQEHFPVKWIRFTAKKCDSSKSREGSTPVETALAHRAESGGRTREEQVRFSRTWSNGSLKRLRRSMSDNVPAEKAEHRSNTRGRAPRCAFPKDDPRTWHVSSHAMSEARAAGFS